MEVNKKDLEAAVDCLQQAMTLIDIAFNKLCAMEKDDEQINT